jgi:hypothetical protein
MLMNLKTVLDTQSGTELFKYLFKHFMVTETVPIGLPDEVKNDWLGYIRAGQSLFSIVAQADAFKAGNIIAETTKEKYSVIPKP